MGNLLKNFFDKRMYLFIMKRFTHLIKTKTITPGLQITANLVSHHHELHSIKHTPLE